ncbi:MAG: hypothetical protein CMJ78_14530 [Planctomycetaceae bacterium]|nr:hypothetical protein [Planctomycetaceae bacterium]
MTDSTTRNSQDDGERTYRCVCGESLLIDAHTSVTCDGCGRKFSANILNEAVADTVSIRAIESPDFAPTVLNDETADLDETAPQRGDMIGHFRVVNILGRGGMGAVYRALDESLQRYVALKVIRRPGDVGDDTVHVQRLLQEARAQARVNHPNVVHIYYVSRDEQSPFLAMELVGGTPLSTRMREGHLKFEQVIRIAIQVASALQQSAKFDIVHGDIKPSNILCADDKNVKLSDFGLARRLSECGMDDSPVMGTPNYLSPEVAAGKPLSIQSDMYSLGVTLFEMTFGRLPYSSSGQLHVLERLRAHREDPVEFPETWPTNLPTGWRDVLERLLEKDPANRFASYDELLEALEQLRPVALPHAGRVVRGLAWLVDLMMLSAALQIVFVPLQIPTVQKFPIVRLILGLASPSVPFLAGLIYAKLGTSAGKKLFQIRVADRHGLRLKQSTLFARSVAQLSPIWIIATQRFFEAIGLADIGSLLLIGVAMAMFVDIGLALLHRRSRSLHDVVFRTRVVLDV